MRKALPLFLLVLLLAGCHAEHREADPAQLQHQADSLRQLAGWQQLQLNEFDSAQARTRRELRAYPSYYEEIRRTPAAAWPAERVERYLSDYHE